MDVRVGLWRRLSTKELMLLNCGVGEDSWESLGLQGDQSILREISPGWLICKDPYAGKDWEQKEKGTTEDEMLEWHHQLIWHGFGWTPGVGDGQGGLACCGSWGPKESDTTERLNWTDNKKWISWIIRIIKSAKMYPKHKFKTKLTQSGSFDFISNSLLNIW